MLKKNKKNKKNFVVRKKEKKYFSLKKIFFRLILFVFVVGSFWVLFISEFSQIRKIEFEENNAETFEENRRAEDFVIGKMDEKKYLNFFSKRNFFLFPSKKIAKEFIRNNPLIHEFKINKKFPDKISVKLKKREGVFVWQNSQSCYLIDQAGSVFWQFDCGRGNDFFENMLIVKDRGDSFFELGKVVAPIELAVGINEIRKNFFEIGGFEFEREMEIPSVVAREIILKSKDGWTLFLSVDQSVERAKVFLDNFFEKEIGENEIEKLEYIDLRLKGKIIYKLKNQEYKEENKVNENFPNNN